MRLAPNSVKLVVAGKADDLLAQTFLAAATEWLKILEQLDHSISGSSKPTVAWVIRDAHLNSPMTFVIEAAEKSTADFRPQIIDSYFDGIEALNRSAILPKHFNLKAAESAAKLVNLYDDGALKIEFSASHKRRVQPRRAIASHVETIKANQMPTSAGFTPTRDSIMSAGSLEGIVTDLAARDPVDHFVLKDIVSGESVKCYIQPELEAETRIAWKNRVRVSGAVWLSRIKKGPVRIDVESLRILRDSSELEQFKGNYIDITGGMESSEYVQGLRNAD